MAKHKKTIYKKIFHFVNLLYSSRQHLFKLAVKKLWQAEWIIESDQTS